MSSNDFNLSTFPHVENLLNKSLPSPESNDGETWSSKCVRNLKKTWDADKEGSRTNITNGLAMDKEGNLFHVGYDGTIGDAWGISLGLCKEQCSRNQFAMVTNFNHFATGASSYLLPWLALTAQLPYETKSTGADIMSVCIGLGSPMLMVISLMMTILNKRWIRQKFGRSLSRFGASGGPEPEIVARARAALVIAEDAQQAPVRLVQSNGLLARQIVLNVHTPWWGEANNSLESTRRGVTLSLVAQVSVAVISWILTVVGSLKQKVGDTTEALALSSGSLWIWLVPVILGWILVGTQNKADTIASALETRHSPAREQSGIQVATNFLADPSSVCVNAPAATNGAAAYTPDIRERFWNVKVYGYQRQQGPAFNYARALTWINFADRLHTAFNTAINTCTNSPQDNISGLPDEQENQVRVSQVCGLLSTGCRHGTHSQSPPTPSRPAASTGSPASHTPPVDNHALLEYPSLSEVSSDARSAFWEHLAFSMLMGVFLQWGTTSLAFAMAHETIVKGLGCRSGAYLLYGILSTLGCFSMLLSAALSHSTMHRYELAPHRRDKSLIGAFAVITLLLGRFLLVANTTWLLLISVWELIGFFDSCYCASTEISKQNEGWVLLFKGADAMKDDAQSTWAACIAVGLIIVLVSIATFSLATRKRGDQ